MPDIYYHHKLKVLKCIHSIFHKGHAFFHSTGFMTVHIVHPTIQNCQIRKTCKQVHSSFFVFLLNNCNKQKSVLYMWTTAG